MSLRLLTVRVRQEQDVVVARQRARQIARLLGFDEHGQVRIATAVSELARNVYNYAREGEVEFTVEGETPPQALAVRVSDQGPGIADVGLILSGHYRSPTGMGLGLLGARRLMDRFAIESAPGQGTTVTIQKLLPAGSPFFQARHLGRLADSLAREGLLSPLAEVQQQNQELLHVLDDLRRRQEDLVRLNRELEDTNRGVVALYAELDEKADHLRRADEMKSRFLSHMSHEFRTPLNSILAISKLLQDRTDGDLTPEQERQVGFVRKAAQDLAELVNDLLDLAKVEAGKTVVRPVVFEIKNLFGALRGMLRPLLVTETVHLVFEDGDDLPEMYSDEAKISQILRNFISNALKFTEQGEIRVRAERTMGQRTVVFSVADTGIGIAPADHERIFSEFGQVENPLQKRFKGTGLGLALSRRLADLLGGGITVESEPGRGSTFRLSVPLYYEGRVPAESLAPATAADAYLAKPVEREGRAGREGERTALKTSRAAVVDDEEASRYALRALLDPLGFEVSEYAQPEEALQQVQADRPDVVFLDLVMPGLTGLALLEELRRNPRTRDLPAVLITSKVLVPAEREAAQRLRASILSKDVFGLPQATAEMRQGLARAGWTAPPPPAALVSEVERS